jgi:hypothetical protein
MALLGLYKSREFLSSGVTSRLIQEQLSELFLASVRELGYSTEITWNT